jgi:hypothetical protein
MTSRRLFSMVSHKPNALRPIECCRDAGDFAIEQPRATGVRRQLMRPNCRSTHQLLPEVAVPARHAVERHHDVFYFFMGIVQYC